MSITYVTDIGVGCFAHPMGQKLKVLGRPKFAFRKESDDSITMTIKVNFEVSDPKYLNKSTTSPIPIQESWGDLFVTPYDGKDNDAQTPAGIVFLYDSQNLSVSLNGDSPGSKGNHLSLFQEIMGKR